MPIIINIRIINTSEMLKEIPMIIGALELSSVNSVTG
jgi:hypothetical protein